MSDNQGDRPEEHVPSSTPQNISDTPAVTPPTPTETPVQGVAPQGAPAWQAAPTQPYPRPPHPGTPAAYPAPPRGGYAGQPVYQGAPQPQAAPAGVAFGPAAGAPSSTVDQGEPRRKSGAGKVVALVVAAALVGGAAGLGGTYAGFQLWGGQESTPAASSSTITVNNPDDVNATTAVAAKVVPSVVTISASAGSSGGTGSGVILSADGYVLTNTHVVTLDGQAGDATITATTSDGRVWKATVVGTDPTYDLAVIKLTDASGLTPIQFANSDDLNVGDATVAVGAPLGLSNTVTTGIVSALNRSIAVASSAAPDDGQGTQDDGGQESPFFFDFGQGQQGSSTTTESINIAVIQTDAAINPGNSGGALVDDEGKLIGINVAIASAGGSSSSSQAGSIGVGFAIPSDIAQRVAGELIENGAATHGLLGANVQSANTVSGTDIVGAYIAKVSDGGAAAQAGLQTGDIVTAFDGKPITSSVDLTAQVRALAGGAKTTLTYLRDGQSRTVDVTLGTLTQ